MAVPGVSAVVRRTKVSSSNRSSSATAAALSSGSRSLADKGRGGTDREADLGVSYGPLDDPPNAPDDWRADGEALTEQRSQQVHFRESTTCLLQFAYTRQVWMTGHAAD